MLNGPLMAHGGAGSSIERLATMITSLTECVVAEYRCRAAPNTEFTFVAGMNARTFRKKSDGD
jgi:hypothetical protein